MQREPAAPHGAIHGSVQPIHGNAEKIYFHRTFDTSFEIIRRNAPRLNYGDAAFGSPARIFLAIASLGTMLLSRIMSAITFVKS
jgi:hypothetical protein